MCRGRRRGSPAGRREQHALDQVAVNLEAIAEDCSRSGRTRLLRAVDPSPDRVANPYNALVRLVTWNIRGGGGEGVARVADVLHALDADVAVLTETTAKRTPALREALCDRGLLHVEATSPPEREYGTMIASRSPTKRIPLETGPAAHRTLLVAVEQHALSVAGCYMPLPASGGRGSTLQADFWRWLGMMLDQRQHESMLVAGDWNTCAAVDGAGQDLPCAEQLVDMQRRGWRSAYRAINPEVRAHSWWHHTGSAFRIDDAYVSPGFRGAVRKADYVRSVGENILAWDRQGAKPTTTLSDHAALVVDLDVSAQVTSTGSDERPPGSSPRT
jgi:exonuclease III